MCLTLIRHISDTKSAQTALMCMNVRHIRHIENSALGRRSPSEAKIRNAIRHLTTDYRYGNDVSIMCLITESVDTCGLPRARTRPRARTLPSGDRHLDTSPLMGSRHVVAEGLKALDTWSPSISHNRLHLNGRRLDGCRMGEE